jgi:DNA repair photolyase
VKGRGEPRRGIVGRGAAGNPKNRFERIEVEPDLDELEGEGPRPETVYLRDHSRSIVARNDSPDIGFDASINPYRGCSHGCVYCVSGDTLVLVADGRTRPIRDLRAGDEIYGTVRRGSYRRYTKTHVLAHWSVRKPAYRITLADGTRLVAGGDHRFLTGRGWKFVTGAGQGKECRPHLTTNNKLMGTGMFASPPEKNRDYKLGYLCGIVRGGGLLGVYYYNRAGGVNGSVVHQFRLALADEEALERASRYLLEFGVATRNFVFQRAFAGRRDIHAIRASSRASVEHVKEMISWQVSPSESWRRGFLAGIFDAEGSYGANTLRIHNTEPEIIERITECLEMMGFRFIVETLRRGRARSMKVVWVCGGLREHLRFFHSTDPAISRKRSIEGTAIKSSADLHVASIVPLGVMPLFDITTGTGDFIANGVVSHNCYARPTHEYLGFSAGLDFESRILVKQDAPVLLRRELSSPLWKPLVLSMSGVTDPYQPVEKRLRITRRCLEVLAEFRNPVAVVTKNHLVTRDIDLLSELGRHNAAAVAISLTTLDDDLRRVMEPRTSRPVRRLAAIKALSEAGIPVGVMTAPVIPGLNDHELPALLSAAAEAGATFAAYVPVRLPHAVGPLFEDWLSRHFPDRKAKVLNRIRSMRGGRLNDPHFGSRMKGEGLFADHIAQLFSISCNRAGIGRGRFPKLSTAAFRKKSETQPGLFDSGSD